MWFFDPARLEVYWFTREDERDQEIPKLVPEVAPNRKIDGEYDYIWDRFSGRDEAGNRIEFNWVLTTNLVANVEVAKQTFPKEVTLDNLAKFFGASTKKSESIGLDAHAVLQRNQNSFHLFVDGIRVVTWAPYPPEGGRITWLLMGYLTSHQIDALNKYLGSTWKVVEKKGLVGLESNKAGWVPATQHVALSIDGSVANDKDYQPIAKKLIETSERVSSMVDKYVQTITTTKVTTATHGMVGTVHPIVTRCDGCQACNGMHLEVHMARNDLDAYLIYAAYDAFGSEVYGGPLRNTWDLIADPSRLRVEAFKEVMRKFLLDTLRQKVSYATFMPMQRRQGSMARWQLFGRQRMLVDGGNRLVPARRENQNDDGLRDGEWLAHEVVEQRRQRAQREYPVARLRREREPILIGVEGGVQFNEANRPIAWEPEPFDINLDLDEPMEDDE